MLSAHGSLKVHLAARDYEVWALAERPIQAEGKRYWHMGVRLGPNACGEGSNEAKSVKCALPTLTETSARELTALLSVPGHVGYPPAMKSDDPSGLACMRYQRFAGAFGSCDADVCFLVRLVSTTPPAYPATK